MAKPGLGRGLGELLDGAGVAGRASGTNAPTPPPSAPVTAGVGSLLRGASAPPDLLTAPPVAPNIPQPRPKQTALKVSLFVADGLLCGLAAVLVYRKTAPLTHGELVLCSVAVVVAAWLGCQALLLDRAAK